MDWKTTAVMSGIGLAATWMASAPPVPPRAPVGATPQAPVAQAVESPIEREAALLARGLDFQAQPGPPSRNPFRFGARPVAPAPAPAPIEVVASAPVVVAASPAFSLAGIATDEVDGAPVRTAILSGPSGIVLARVGDAVSGYRVEAVEADAVALAPPGGGAPVRLSLRP